MSKIEVDAIEPQSGTTLTIGASGDTITIPSGATLSSTDPLVFPAGTVSLPSITTTGDTNTGIFFPAADTIGFAEGGAEAMRIDSSGNVGIGTSSPDAKLHVNGLIEANGSLYRGIFGGAVQDGDMTGATGGNGSEVQIQSPSSGRPASLTLGGSLGNNESLGVIGFYNSGNTDGKRLRSYIRSGQEGATANEQGARMVFATASNAASTPTERMRIDSSGSLILAGSTAQKASGTTWSNPSDTRLKDNKQNYTKGLKELLQINVKTWEWNGKAGTTQGDVGIGVIADEIETILPNTIDTYKAKLNEDDTEETDVKRFDATEITWLLLNSVQEQQAIIEELKATLTSQQTKIDSLEARLTALESN